MLVGGEDAGWLGEIHPAVARAWDLDGAAAGFELDLGVIERAALHVPRYEDVTSFPAVLQDRAWWFAPDVPAADVLATVREAGGALLRAPRSSTSIPPRTACRWPSGSSSAPATAR